MAALKVRNTLEKKGAFEALVDAFNTLVTNCNASVGSVTGVNLLKTDHNLAAADVKALVTELTAARVDLAALRTTLAAAVTDIAAMKSAHDTLIAKLNLDAGVTDTDYAQTAALTGSAPEALTVSAIAAASVQGSVAAVTAGGIVASDTITLVDC